MKKIILVCLLSLIISSGFAAHIIGGELRYEFVGPGSLPNTKIYKIILLLVKGDATGPTVADLAPFYLVGIFNNDNNTKVPGPITPNQMWQMPQDNPPGILPVPITASPCLTNQPSLQYTYATYSLNVELPDNNNGYTIAHQTCCRQANMANVNQTGATYTCVIPGVLQLLSEFEVDNCPRFGLPISVICFESPFTLDFSSTDADGDSLVYGFCNAFDGGLAVNSGYDDAFPPPYNSVDYINPFSAVSPLGSQAFINPQTGIISGIAPAAGNYVVCVCVRAYRNGRLITTHRKDLLVRVSPCVPTIASPDPGYTTCDGFNIQFSHNSSGANSVFWDFGDPSTDSDTSTLDNPVYVYPDTGIFIVKFIINKGGNCSDSQNIVMGIYPGFFPGYQANAPFCAGQAVQFSDTTQTAFGVVDSWSWNFGNTATLADTSHLENPQYVYPAAGTYTTRLIVTNSKGCVDTVFKNVTVNPLPNVAVPPDTIYCGRDSLQLTATGTAGGTYTWQPSTSLIGASTATPVAFPTVPTTYFATINVAGCRKTDSIRISPALDLTTDIIANPTSICEEDTLTLTGTSNYTSHLSWQWSPPGTVQSASSKITRAFPLVTTNFTLTTRWGEHCVATKTVNIPVRQLADPVVGPDAFVCINQTTTTLTASGGNTYSWTPTAGLSNPNIPNPVASPTSTTNYVVHVGVNGCSKTRSDTVNVLVRQRPPIAATNDTLICVVDGLQLNVSGTGSIQWSPNYNLNSTTSATPFATPVVDTIYRVRLTDIFGCVNTDSVRVRVKPKTEIFAGPDTSICRTEGYVLHTTGDALHYSWTPATGLSNDSIKNPRATPLQTTTYQVIGNIGTCSDTSQLTIVVAPYPIANAGLDSTICIGFNAQLFASGGSRYSWSPATYLSNPNIPNPLVQQPASTTTYTVTVSDTLGCTKTFTDAVQVIVIPQLNVRAGIDTTLVQGQPIRLNGSGAVNYNWTWMPPTLPGWLSSQTVASPTATPQDNIMYVLTGTDTHGCRGTDSVNITVYNVPASMYVPTAFTPNGDGLNDDIKPILLGMKSLTYFRVFNRLGQLVYETTQQEVGWNGIFNGKPQDPGTFVWMAQGVTFKGQVITKKGSVVLLR